MTDIHVPLTVPRAKRREYLKNLEIATAGSGSLFLFAGDQKVEHLNADFSGRGISPEDASPEHLFQIAAASPIGVFATNLGLIAQYGETYPKVPYLVKLNGRTNLYTNTEELNSPAWLSVADVLEFKKQSGLNILGIGYTVYLGGRHETAMLREAAQLINEAHHQGLLAVIWMYPRGAAIKEDDIRTIAGGAGVAAALGADFVKVKYPYNKKMAETAKAYREVVKAAGRTKVICVGGSKQEAKDLLAQVWQQQTEAGVGGLALGRNLHQRPLPEAIRLATALALIINHGASLADALAVYAGRKKVDISRRASSDRLGFF